MPRDDFWEYHNSAEFNEGRRRRHHQCGPNCLEDHNADEGNEEEDDDDDNVSWRKNDA